ncbi:hypothetical protein THI4931_29720 [Pandoraea sputorum]|nr:hypothetical protein THI4931_29720 [Pandoraea sputorum]
MRESNPCVARAPCTFMRTRCFSRWRLSAIMLVSEMEKNPEQMIRKATAQICAHKGKASKRFGAAKRGRWQ